MNGSRVTTLRPKVLPDEAIAVLHAVWLECPEKFEKLVGFISGHARPAFGTVTITFQDRHVIMVEKYERIR